MDGHFSVGKIYVWNYENTHGTISYIVYVGNHYNMFEEKSKVAFIEKGDTVVILELYALNSANNLIQDIKVLTNKGIVGWIRVHKYHLYQWKLVE